MQLNFDGYRLPFAEDTPATIVVLALILLAGCTAEPPPVSSTPIRFPTAEEQKQQQRLSDLLMAKWSECQVAKVRELARTDLPAPEAVSEALAKCDKEREDWVRAQGSNIRYQAEYAASQAETGSYPIYLGYILDLRRGHPNEDSR
jgi:hypothetical protein